MVTGQDLVDAAARFVGEPYSTGPGRCDPNSGYKDCSGLVCAAYKVATGDVLGATVSSTQYALALRAGLDISFAQAARTPGALLFMPADPLQGFGPLGHVGFSDGRGGTVEATPPRVQRLSLSYQPWGPCAALLPGIDYSGVSASTPKDDFMRLFRNTDNGDWWLFTALGFRQVTPAQVWNYAAQGIPQSSLPGGDIFWMAVQITEDRKALARTIREI